MPFTRLRQRRPASLSSGRQSRRLSILSRAMSPPTHCAGIWRVCARFRTLTSLACSNASRIASSFTWFTRGIFLSLLDHFVIIVACIRISGHLSFPERLPKSKVWSDAETRSFAAQILSLIEYLHSQKIYGSKLELKARFCLFLYKQLHEHSHFHFFQPEKLYLDGQTLKMEDVGINQAAYPTEDKLRSIGKGNKSYYVCAYFGALQCRLFFFFS